MKSLSIAILVAGSIVSPRHAIAQQGNVLTATDSSIAIRHRYEHDTNGALTRDQAQYDIDLKLQLRLDKDGKWKLMSRVETGKPFNTGWNDLGIGSDTQFVDALNVRQIYLQYETPSTKVSAGAIPLNPSPRTRGAFSFDDDGWIDGARFESTKLGTWAKRVSVTVGRIDQLNTPSVFARGVGIPNVIQVHVQGNLDKRVTYMVEGTQFSPPSAPGEQFLRGMIEIATSDVLHFVDKVVLETLVQNSSAPIQAFSFSAQSAITKNWSLTAQYTHKGHELSANENVYAPREDFYREGDQLNLLVTRQLNFVRPMELGLSFGKTVSGPKKDGTTSVGLWNSSGLRVDTKLKIKF